MNYDELLDEKDREIERLRSVIKHMCDELCSGPKNCMMTDCPSSQVEPETLK